MNHEAFLHLTTLYLEDAINADDLELLNRELANSPDRVQQFNDLRLVTGLINEHGRPIDSVSVDNIGANFSSESPSHASSAIGFGRTTSTLRPSMRALAVAALATVALLLLFLNFSGIQLRRDSDAPQRNLDTPGIATLEYTSHAKWENKQRVEGDQIGKGKLHLKIGLARLDFHNGATVTLQGPAQFEIVSPNRTILTSGILTASVPDSAVGF